MPLTVFDICEIWFVVPKSHLWTNAIKLLALSFVKQIVLRTARCRLSWNTRIRYNLIWIDEMWVRLCKDSSTFDRGPRLFFVFETRVSHPFEFELRFHTPGSVDWSKENVPSVPSSFSAALLYQSLGHRSRAARSIFPGAIQWLHQEGTSKRMMFSNHCTWRWNISTHRYRYRYVRHWSPKSNTKQHYPKKLWSWDRTNPNVRTPCTFSQINQPKRVSITFGYQRGSDRA